MVVKMMKWRPWPPLPSKKFDARITLNHLRGLDLSPELRDSCSRFTVEIRWKGPKGIALRRSVRRNFTKEGFLGSDGVVRWDEEFRCLCNFSSCKDGALFHPWEVSFTLLNGLKQGKNNNGPVFATASLNLADFASAAEKQDVEVNIPLTISNGLIDTSASLLLSITLLELRNTDEPSEPTAMMPRTILSFPRSPCYGQAFSSEKEETEISTCKRAPRRSNIFEGLSAMRAKRTGHHEEECSDGKSSVRSEETEFNYPLDDETDSSDEVKDNSRVVKPFNYGTLAYANYAGASSSVHSNTSSSEGEDWIYYSHHRDSSSVYDDCPAQLSSKRSRLSAWRKRKLSFRSPKVKGEPLLRKDYREEGGDDIDFDRRQFSSSDESTSSQHSVENKASVSAFGDDDNFAVGIWESKEITSRDGQMKLKTQVFFASIDQRSERAAGESACTALVAVIADWLQSNHDGLMPIKSQLDSLIREGSLEWRNLCENETYREKFPDKHFDLETVLEAKVRPLMVVPEKSFVGFFRPEGLEENGFDFLQGAMSFDSIWDEICSISSSDPLVYIISWNDHFFVLKVEKDAYYIIDTLGERLYEGCNQAFILKFDRDTIIHRIADESEKSDDKPAEHSETEEGSTGTNGDVPEKNEKETAVVCTGKESCKEYIKNFLAAIPIRELQIDLKKGLMASSTPLHHRLQIEFHYTRCLQDLLIKERSVIEATDDEDAEASLPTTEVEN